MESGFHGYRKLYIPGGSGSQMNIPPYDNNINRTNTIHHTSSEDNECTVREQDRFMPIANVIRIMRKILPPHAKISDDAKETIQECVSEYISFITGEANDRCQREQRKTITAEDVLWAMSKLGFDDYVEPLTLYLHRYRELEGERCTIRADSLMKRNVPVVSAAAAAPTMDYGNVGIKAPLGMAGIAASRGFHMGNHHHPNLYHHHGFYGVSPNMVGGGYVQEGNGDGSSSGDAQA